MAEERHESRIDKPDMDVHCFCRAVRFTIFGFSAVSAGIGLLVSDGSGRLVAGACKSVTTSTCICTCLCMFCLSRHG